MKHADVEYLSSLSIFISESVHIKSFERLLHPNWSALTNNRKFAKAICNISYSGTYMVDIRQIKNITRHPVKILSFCNAEYFLCYVYHKQLFQCIQ